MSANSVVQPFPIITDTDGTALENGFVYIGTAGLNPETNPITIYWDKVLSSTALQPVSTINGYFSHNGSPGIIFVDADDYSITVKDKNGALVYTSLNSNESIPFGIITGQIGSERVDFLQSGTGATTRTVQSKLRDVIHAQDFDESLSSGDDWTAAIQESLDELESRGGGICVLPVGTLYISIFESVSTYSCLVIPSNVILQGAGMGATVIQRLPVERGDFGNLITNKYWDVNGVYTAAGNIVFQDFTITDGPTTPTSANHNLIGLGHSDNVIVQRIEALNCDGHFVDICGSKRVQVINCIGHNQVVIAAASTIQIDGAYAGAIWGIFDDGTITVDVEIAHNHFKNEGAHLLINLGHKQLKFENINIHDNVLDGGYIANESVISCDNNTSFSNYKIVNNTIITNHESAKAVDIFIEGNSSETINNFLFSGNIIKGLARRAIFIGCDATYSGSDFPGWKGLVICNNNIDISSDTSIIVAIHVGGFDDVIIESNNIVMTQDDDASVGTAGIVIDKNKSCIVSNNIIQKIISSPTLTAISVGIEAGSAIPLSSLIKSSISIFNNMIIADGFKYLLRLNNFSEYRDEIVFSKNKMGGTPESSGYLISESFAASDGTNFKTQVEFAADDHTQTLAVGTLYSGLLLPGKKDASTSSVFSPAIIQLLYAPAGAFDTDIEILASTQITTITDPSSPITFTYTSVGTMVVDINQFLGTFAIITGDEGVQYTIDRSTFEPVIRTGGILKAWASI